MPSGTLQVYTALAENAAPLPGVTVLVLNEAGTQIARLTTNDVGSAPELVLTAPDEAYSLDEANTTVRPYAVYQLRAEMTGFQTIELEGVQVFAGQQTVARLQFLPAARTLPEVEPETIPEHPLFAGNGGSGPAPIGQCADARVLSEVVVPKKITVHLARPAVSAANVTVSFQDYIANVASSEVYPTWPEQALRANILAQISLALNRIWTEWYPSRGYSFNITNSPGVDQAYVRGRTVFAVMERLTAELFNTYVRRTGDTEPYYTEYCDGKSVTCPGMKQWGTVERAKEGKSALEILRYYYGSRVQLVTTNNIASIPQSYPGSPLRRGSTGTAVNVLQKQLSRIAKDYPSFGKPAITGTFDEATENSVKKFQKQFSLTVDGVVGKATWYKISYIYVSVKDLAELTSEYLYSRRITRPIFHMLNVTNDMKNLKPEAAFHVQDEDEVGLLAEQINQVYEQLLATIRSLDEEKEHMLAVEKSKTVFLRSASHELKTPLSGLRILLENMQFNIGKYKDRDKYLAEAVAKVDELSGMVRDILDTSKVQDLQEEEKQKLCAGGEIGAVLQEYAMQIADKKLEVTDSIPEDCMLFMSRNTFQKVWSNLIGNAVQYTEQGGQITIAADTDKIWIENSCIPLTEEQLAYIYEPFYRVDDTRAASGGNGLGLYVVRELLKKEGFRYVFEPVEDGMRFTIFL